MQLLERFLDPASVSLKICGVTTREDAAQLAEMGVDALGVNFWPSSKRYVAPDEIEWLIGLADKILRVGVFVNSPPELPLRLMREGLLDVVQFHGDETPEEAAVFHASGVPFIKALGVRTRADLSHINEFKASAILLDSHAPGVYGGTGAAFDWHVAANLRNEHPDLPILLAGGIVPDNASLAAEMVHPAAIDIASGAEISPGIKDFKKVAAFLTALRS